MPNTTEGQIPQTQIEIVKSMCKVNDLRANDVTIIKIYLLVDIQK